MSMSVSWKLMIVTSCVKIVWDHINVNVTLATLGMTIHHLVLVSASTISEWAWNICAVFYLTCHETSRKH